MTATSRAPRRSRIIRPRGPPPAPTPIRTARGARSAAADERMLADFLEASLRVPDLALPPPRKRFSFPPDAREGIAISSRALVSGDADASRRAVAAAAAGPGAFLVAAGGVDDAREAREAVEAAGPVFAAPEEEVRRQLGRAWFRRRDHRTGGEELCWFRPVRTSEDRALDADLPAGSTYRAFRQDEPVYSVIRLDLGYPKAQSCNERGRPMLIHPTKFSTTAHPTHARGHHSPPTKMASSNFAREKMDTVASKMEDIAKTVIRVLSDNARNPNASSQFREAPSILCLKLHDSNMSKTGWNEFGSADPPDHSHALCIHLCGRDRQICLRNQGGSTFFSLPAGSMLVTIGKQVQEWSNGQFKSAVGEVLFEMTDEPDPFISVELTYSPDDLHLSEFGGHARCISRPKAVSFRDQILIALLLLSFFYLFW
ncbi:hypothetical protein U9M48_017322 [Paspalum notatum var. saurae]|uniref:Uncharacterized protein n=1 Tax=Paspalum notatum var. saurae TaxID=547442 RepID=A0AAQ3WP77_PASNO